MATAETKYSVNSHLIETVLSWIRSAEIAIPEIQHPFVWDSTKVRDLMDSLYQGYPVGYLIAWRNPDVRTKEVDKGFLSRDISVSDLINFKGDIHHVFPKEYLKKNGFKKAEYNQIANYVYMQSEINIRVGSRAPQKYFKELVAQLNGAAPSLGAIDNQAMLDENLLAHCIPKEVVGLVAGDYQLFLERRRLLMASKMRAYYGSL